MTREPFIAHSELTNEIYIVIGKEKYRVTEQAIKAVKAIRSLEQEPTTKNDLAVDAVSRDEVCRYVAEFVNHEFSTREEEELIDNIITGIEHMPSVTPQEPQSFKWCETCKEYDQEKHCCHRYSKVIRNTVAEIRQEPVLDKLRAEIELKEKTLTDKYGQQKYGIWTDDVLQIIDEYKAETENP